MEPERLQKILLQLEMEVGKTIVGHKGIIRKVLLAFLSGGHVLLEGVPGLGKTLLIKSMSRALGLSFKRVQFTPDLMPSDIIGTQVLTESDGRRDFEFKRGPLFAQVVLADEINRATPKTQSAVLEAMEERQVTVFGETFPLDSPFMVLATQNPIELEGTYPLPEAQLDRFFFKLLVTPPTPDQLREVLHRTSTQIFWRAPGREGNLSGIGKGPTRIPSSRTDSPPGNSSQETHDVLHRIGKCRS